MTMPEHQGARWRVTVRDCDDSRVAMSPVPDRCPQAARDESGSRQHYKTSTQNPLRNQNGNKRVIIDSRGMSKLSEKNRVFEIEPPQSRR
jgi:hypothetical protein